MNKTLLLPLLFSLNSVIGIAQLPTWNHITPITITENSGATVTDYQMLLTINTMAMISSNSLNADGSDLRFTSACTGGDNFPYWIESGLNTPNTKIYVKINQLPASSERTIYMHYGNSAAPAASSAPATFDGNHSATNNVSVSSLGYFANCQRGFRFKPNEDILVTDFGKREPDGATKTVTLFDMQSQAVLRQQQVSGASGTLSYEPISQPIWLNENQEYTIQLFSPAATQHYFYGTSSQINSKLTYLDVRYCNNCTENTFPTETVANQHYGVPDFKFYTKKTVTPAPTYMYTLSGSGSTSQMSGCTGNEIELGINEDGLQTPYTVTWNGPNLITNNAVPGTANPTSNATYTMTLTDGCGFVRKDTIAVTMFESPNFDITASATTLCEEGSIDLSINTTLTDISWSTGETTSSITVTPASTTTYGVTVESTEGCATTKNVTINIVDTTIVIARVGNMLTTETVGSSYQWINCITDAPIAGATSQQFQFTENGSYALIATINGCPITSNCIEIGGVGITKVEADLIAVYPNPNDGIFEIVSQVETKVIVSTLLGQVVDSFTIEPNTNKKIDLSSFGKGIYLIHTQSEVVKIEVK